MFTDNESNPARVSTHVARPGDSPSSRMRSTARSSTTNRERATQPRSQVGSKAAIHYRFGAIRPGETVTLHFRFLRHLLHRRPAGRRRRLWSTSVVAEADAYYASIHPPEADPRTFRTSSGKRWRA